MSRTLNNSTIASGERLLLGFAVFSVLNVAAAVIQLDWLGYLTKPLLISTLAVWYYQQSKNVRHNRYSQAFLVGLCFSVLGDTMLMFVKTKGELFFLLGLGSFLVAHLCYILAFIYYPAFRTGIISLRPWYLLPFLAILATVVWYLWEDLGELRIPVVAYALIIIGMSASCLNMRKRVPNHISQTLFLGAVLFVVSDFTIAFTKFKEHGFSAEFGGFIIMVTYLSGQFLLTKGMKKAGERFA